MPGLNAKSALGAGFRVKCSAGLRGRWRTESSQGL